MSAMSDVDLSSKFRVMQETETGESFNVFEGNEAQCDDWIDENEDEYEESSFFVEEANRFRFL